MVEWSMRGGDLLPACPGSHWAEQQCHQSVAEACAVCSTRFFSSLCPKFLKLELDLRTERAVATVRSEGLLCDWDQS